VVNDIRDAPIPSELSNQYILEWVASKRGSISAEHGLGQQKRDYLHLAKPEPVIQVRVTEPRTVFGHRARSGVVLRRVECMAFVCSTKSLGVHHQGRSDQR
jgi:hypothetical protein